MSESLLRDILIKRGESSGFEPPKALASKRGLKSYASSILSSGSTVRSVRSIAESVASFYSLISGGSRVPKRRRPDVSRLGVPKFYKKNPKAAIDMPGVKYLDSDYLGPYTCAHAKSFGKEADTNSPYWGSIILYNHGSPEDARPKYHGRARVMGEVRIVLTEPTAITSVDVWLVGKQECVLDVNQKPFLNAVAHVWDRTSGDPSLLNTPRKVTLPFKGRFPAGTYVFPFEFPPLPRDAAQHQMDFRLAQPKNTRMHLPASHEFSMTAGWSGWNGYFVGVNIKEDLGALSAEWTFPFDYFPRGRPLVVPPSPFPFFATREDWPMKREDVGGWTLTPFGGRGRWRGERMVEIEGLLGVQAPPVHAPGQRLRFGLLLWCTDEEVLRELSRPEAFQVDFLRTDIFGLDVIDPHNSSRRNRHLTRVGAAGRIWPSDGPVLADDAPAATPLVPRVGSVRDDMTSEAYTHYGNVIHPFTITQSGLGGERAMEYAAEADVAESAVDLTARSIARLWRFGIKPVPTLAEAAAKHKPVGSAPTLDPVAGGGEGARPPTPVADVERDWTTRSATTNIAELSVLSGVSDLCQIDDKGKARAYAESFGWSVDDMPVLRNHVPIAKARAYAESFGWSVDDMPVLQSHIPVAKARAYADSFGWSVDDMPVLHRHVPVASSLSRSDTNGTPPSKHDEEELASPTSSTDREVGLEARTASPKESCEDADEGARASSPKGLDNTDRGGEPAHTVRLDGDLVIPRVTPPSYRWKYQGVEYVLHLLLQHPDYLHLSPGRQSGIVAETPLWIVTDPPKPGGADEPLWTPPTGLDRMPKHGHAIPVPADAHTAPKTIGEGTDAVRPAWRSAAVRTWAFM